HDHVAGKQCPVAFDEGRGVATGVRRADGEQLDADATQVERVAAVERDVRLSVRGPLQELRPYRRLLRERLGELQPELGDVGVFAARLHYFGARRKRLRAEIVLGMDVS